VTANVSAVGAGALAGAAVGVREDEGEAVGIPDQLRLVGRRALRARWSGSMPVMWANRPLGS
jgi:hypothetical protein